MCATPLLTLRFTFFLAPFLTIFAPAPGLLLRRSLLLAGHRLARALPGARVGVRALPSHGETPAMAKPPVAADVHQQLDVLRRLAAEVAFHLVVALDRLADADDLVLAEVIGTRHRLHPGLVADARSAGVTDAVDVGERDPDLLGARKIDACNACHVLPLSLLVLRVLTENPDHSAPAHDAALVTHLLHGGSNLHCRLAPSRAHSIRCATSSMPPRPSTSRTTPGFW